MSQKKNQQDAAKSDKDKWNKEEDPLQAVVIADSFNSKFSPITVECPRALLPLVNCKLLDYTIEYLVEEGVQEIILFCCSNANKIKEYASSAKWSQNKECSIQVVVSSSTNCMSFGDALREIDREGLIRSDFLLVPGDLISNVKLTEHIEEHKCLEEDTFIAMDSETKRILHCQKSYNTQKFSFPVGLLAERDHVHIRYDLTDCNIAICSPTVPPLFTDNFDYQSKEDFVRGILINEEIMGNQIHCHIIKDEYAARVSNLHMYNAISLDLINRWVYPVVPDGGSYRFTRHNVYLDKGVRLARNSLLEQDVVVGENSSIETGTRISKTVIGKNCKIGENVQITNSFIWDDVVIENDCLIAYSIVCNDCVIKRNVQMADAITSFKVVVGPDVVVKPGSKFSTLKLESLENTMGTLSVEENNKIASEIDPDLIGSEGNGYLWPECDSDDEDEETLPTVTLRGEFYASEDESSDDESIPSPTGSPPPDAGVLFYHEVLENIRHGIAHNVSSDNIILEVNASKYKHNVSMREIHQAVTKSILESVLEDRERTKQSMVQELEKVISMFMPLIMNYVKGVEAQMEVITTSEEFFAENFSLCGLFPTFLHKLYNKDVLDEVVILKWYSTPVSAEDPILTNDLKKVRQQEQMGRFITWLKEAEEESEEDSEEESD
eukprot:gene5217-355_t